MLLIPVMYLRGGGVLKPAGSAATAIKTDPVLLARDWSNAGVELIHIVDLDAPPAGPSPNTEVFKKLSSELKLGFEVAGHVRSIDTAEKYFSSGASRLIVNSVAYQKPAFLAEISARFPGKIATHIDVRRGRVIIKGWTVATNKSALDYVAQFKEAGINTIYYSDSEEEGVLKPADFSRIRDFLRKSLVKVVHTTDVATANDLEQLVMLEAYGLNGTLLSKSIYDGKIDVESAITLVKERSRGGLDEPTYTEGK